MLAVGCAVVVAAGAWVATPSSSDSHVCNHAPESGGAVAIEKQLVKVTAKRDGNRTRFFVENNEYCEVTMNFEFQIKNLKSTVQFPHKASFPPRQVTEAFMLEPDESGQKWEYSYTNYYKLGSHLARHDDAFLYTLPYAAGSRYKVTQAFGGTYSHKGSNLYAIDWKMPEGTPVHATRGGEVVKIKHDSDTGGPSMKFDPHNNFVLIRHPDGTLGHYCHLLKDSVLVRPGDHISTGQTIARSGNTGFSSGPHLHFCVFKTLDGKTRASVPVKFRTEGESASVLVAGRNYRATSGVQTAGVGSSNRRSTAVGAGTGASGS